MNDRMFDLFDHLEPQGSSQPILMRPPIRTAGRIVWGFGYETLMAPHAEKTLVDPALIIPIITVGEKFGISDLIRLALTAEGRSGSYRWREVDRIISVIETRASETLGSEHCVPETGTAGTDAAMKMLRPPDRTDPGERHAPGGESDRSGGRYLANVPSDILELIDPNRDVRASLRVFRRLGSRLRDAVDSGEIDMRTAELLPAVLAPFVDDLLDLGTDMSYSERRQLFRMVGDVVRVRDGDTGIIDELKRNATGNTLDILRRQRNPRTSEIEDRLKRFQNEYTRGTGVSVELPKNYEGDHVEIRFRARSQKEFDSRINTLKKMKEQVDDLLGLLF